MYLYRFKMCVDLLFQHALLLTSVHILNFSHLLLAFLIGTTKRSKVRLIYVPGLNTCNVYDAQQEHDECFNALQQHGEFFSWFVKLIMIFTCQFCCLGQIEFLSLICVAVYSISWHSNYVDLELALTIGQSM